jgi:tripartite-type tricarboxylate transporter receptor subunit TctC
MFRSTLPATPLTVALLMCLAHFPASAQTFPSKPVRVISTLTAGSPADGLIRIASQRLAESLGGAVVVEVQAGAGGILGAQAVARAAPDGHTLLYTLSTTIVITPQLLKNRPYELKDFTPILVASRAAISMLAHVSFPPNNIRELVDYAKANPGKLAYGSNGIGGTYHLEMEMLKQAHNLDIAHVPYKGGTDALLAVVAGTIPIGFAPAASAMSQVRSGKVKILAILDYQRVADFPDIPSMGEQFSGYEKMSSGVDLYGPAGLSPALLKRLNAELVKAFSQPDVRQRMKEISFPYDGTGPEDMLATRIKELASSARAIKAAGLKPE